MKTLKQLADIGATDEFKSDFDKGRIQTANMWGKHGVGLIWTGYVSYQDLAANYLRRQHGSTEWKPCTKEETV
jgi:hypothetical protein